VIFSVVCMAGGCTSPATTGKADPGHSGPPPVTVTNLCGFSQLCTALCDTLSWAPGGQTTSCIFVTNAGTYSVTCTSNGCTSDTGTAIASPIQVPQAPNITVTDACGYSILCASDCPHMVWSTGATSSCITVTAAGDYSVVCVNDGCFSLPGHKPVNPHPKPVVFLGNDTTITYPDSI